MHQVLIKFEGKNASGKSLLMRFIQEHLSYLGYKVVTSDHNKHQMEVEIDDLGKLCRNHIIGVNLPVITKKAMLGLKINKIKTTQKEVIFKDIVDKHGKTWILRFLIDKQFGFARHTLLLSISTWNKGKQLPIGTFVIINDTAFIYNIDLARWRLGKRGLGKAILKIIEKFCKSNGAKRITGEITKDGRRAIDFWKKQGYVYTAKPRENVQGFPKYNIIKNFKSDRLEKINGQIIGVNLPIVTEKAMLGQTEDGFYMIWYGCTKSEFSQFARANLQFMKRKYNLAELKTAIKEWLKKR
jgi:GNAT superfamily N-acetyltransferase